MNAFVRRQFAQIGREGSRALFRKLSKAARWAALSIPVLGLVVAIRLIRPWLLVRIGVLSQSIGHLTFDTELHLCEADAGINVPERRHVNLYFTDQGIVCNRQLAKMWKRRLNIGPEWLLRPVLELNRRLPGAAAHAIILTTSEDLDILNLLDRFEPHLRFTASEEARGRAGLQAMGIPPGAPYVCLIARDTGYNAVVQPAHDQSGDNYRNSDIQDFVPAALELAGRGYFVIRMGVHVREAMTVADPNVIDYATNGMRSDFMDIYLGANCAFCVGSSTGFTCVPMAFRRPVVTVDAVPFGYLDSRWEHALSITKRHYSVPEGRELTLREIFERGAGLCLDSAGYESKGVRLIANTPEEIRDVTIEMAERVEGTWTPAADDEALQKRFWEVFPLHSVSPENQRPLHGEVRGRYGAAFLRANRWWLK